MILLDHISSKDNEELFLSLIQKQSEKLGYAEEQEDHSLLLNATFNKIKQAIANDKNALKAAIIPLYNRFWFRSCAAAVLILLAGASFFYILNPKKERSLAENVIARKEQDIPPGKNNAILTLSNGKSIVLDTASNGTLAQQGNMNVLKLNGQITYKTAEGMMNEKPVYNTISTSIGNQYQLTLADGSKVWLNAASSIHFPTSFTLKERKVTITGEAYFEVAHDSSKPFKVAFSNPDGKNGEVEVLGTHFNVNTYADEQDVKATLLKGSVKVTSDGHTQMLSPGEQAVVFSHGIKLKKNIDVSQVTAWKDGYFVFDNTDIGTIMKQAARWYDIDVNFEGTIPVDGFTGKISRNEPLSRFLKVLELNDIHVKVEGRSVTIVG